MCVCVCVRVCVCARARTYAISETGEKKDIDISVLRIMKFATVHMDLACIFRL